MRFTSLFVALLLACFITACACVAAQEITIETAEEALQQGKYETAVTQFNQLLTAKADDERAQQGLLRTYLETGKYTEVETTAKKYLTGKANNAVARLALAEVEALTGRYAEALKDFERVSQQIDEAIKKAGDKEAALDALKPQFERKLRADLRRGELLRMTGKEEESQFAFQSIIKFYEDNDVDEAPALTSIAAALAYLEKYQEAKDMYLDAIAADGKYIDAHIGGGELFTAKYNYAEAADFFKDALEINANSARLHLAIARNRQLDGGEPLQQALAKALSINPNLYEAKLIQASSDLDAERHADAAKKIDEVLKLNPNSLEAYALRAASQWVNHRLPDYEAAVKFVLAINPRSGELYETLAHYATSQRRYDESIVFLRKAIELTPNLWSSHLALGQALLRSNQLKEGREEVELAFKNDPFNIWAKNTLDLLDSMADFRDYNAGEFVVRTNAKESEVIQVYAAELLNEVHAKLAAKYKFTPKSPIVAEIFPNHDDFAVRTLGLPGLGGALGVCFGQLIVQDSPSSRPGGQFNWGSTLWHEYTHVVTLQITDHLIPRWFSEGLSVFEEHNARPGWGDDWNPSHLKALADGRWFKIADLDGGFMRPKRPDDITLAYFEASQICQFINDKYGFDTILAMLRGYKEKHRTPEILRETLKLSEEDFDKAFAAYIESKAGKYVKALESGWKNKALAEMKKEDIYTQAAAQPDDFTLNLRAGMLYVQDKAPDKAIPHLKRCIELFPYQSGAGNAYELLAGIYETRGDKAATVEMLEALVKVDENNYDALQKLSKLKLEQGDKARALELLKLAFFVNPFDHAEHTAAGNLQLEANQNDAAIREFQVALAANPPNIAEAQFNLARGFLAAGKVKEARRTVLKSLELAPGFDKAQDLLLKLVGNP
ncbi:MAG: tetratricopeptide repeat protein [Acidobacteria bacterium]|nr:tetratricopeptide repeat protein [Acidobacteriota bacterium]